MCSQRNLVEANLSINEENGHDNVPEEVMLAEQTNKQKTPSHLGTLRESSPHWGTEMKTLEADLSLGLSKTINQGMEKVFFFYRKLCREKNSHIQTA